MDARGGQTVSGRLRWIPVGLAFLVAGLAFLGPRDRASAPEGAAAIRTAPAERASPATGPAGSTAAPAADPARPAPARLVEVELRAGLTPADLASLRAQGARFEELEGPGLFSAPGHTRAIFRADAAGVAALQAHAAVASVGLPSPFPKIAAEVDQMGDGPMALMVIFPDGTSQADALDSVHAAGLDVPDARLRDGRWVAARAASRAQVEALASDDRVRQVWMDPRPAEVTNTGAATASNVNQLWSGGASGANLTGQGVTLALWDGGVVRSTHVELSGRVTNLLTGSPSFHPTHVAGTMIGTGVNSSAHGMSPAATVRAYGMGSNAFAEWYRDRSLFAACNNSWGYITGWYNYGGWTWFGPPTAPQDPNFGKYNWACQWADDATEDDDVLAIAAAGNPRSTVGPGANAAHYHYGYGTTVYTDFHQANNAENGYDTLAPFAAAKNVLVVGAVDWNNRNDDASSANFSAWGPADDGRIKPDLCARGVWLTSSGYDADNTYYMASGTSMATPTVTGTMGLLVEYLRRRGYGGATYLPPASLLKAIVLNTTRELESTGPDARTGYGMLDGRAAYDLIRADADAGRWANLRYASLDPNETDSCSMTLTAGQVVRITLAWADADAAANTLGADDPTPALVFDLDLRVVAPDGTTYFPWRLDAANPGAAATRGDNRVDNVEQVSFSAPAAGSYSVRVTCKTPLVGARPYSLASSAALGSAVTPGDTTPPANPAVSVNNGAPSTTTLVVTLTGLSATDDVAVTQMRFSNDGSTWSAWEAFAASRGGWDLSQFGGSAQTGTKTVAAQFRDAAGNVSAIASDSIDYVLGLPNTPVNLLPADGARNAALRPTLSASAYSNPSGSGHAASRWRVTDAAGAVAYDSGVVAASTSHRLATVLRHGTEYRFAVQYQAANGAWSSWSLSTRFTTIARGARVFLGYGAAGRGFAEEQLASGGNFDWLQIPLSTYVAGVDASTRVACGDIDGDGANEVVVGLGPSGGGRAYVFDDEAAGFRPIGWLPLGWSTYAGGSSPIYPACGDLNGDGRDEIVLGLGPRGSGWFRIFRYVNGTFSPFAIYNFSGGWMRTGFPDYASATFPACGDLNADGRDEIVIGTAQYGYAQIQTLVSGYLRGFPGTPIAGGKIRTGWSTYDNAVNAPVFPAVGDLDGDGRGDVVMGLGDRGAGRVRILRSASTIVPMPGTPMAGGWLAVPLSSYVSGTRAPTFPACGDLNADGADDLVIGLGDLGAGRWFAASGRTFGPLAGGPAGGFGQTTLSGYATGAAAPVYPAILR